MRLFFSCSSLTSASVMMKMIQEKVRTESLVERMQLVSTGSKFVLLNSILNIQHVHSLPFMAIFNFKPSSSVKCTASLITQSWLVSAAHCLVAKKHFEELPCISKINLGLDIKCRKTPKGDIEAHFYSQEYNNRRCLAWVLKIFFLFQIKGRTAEVFVGVDNLNTISPSTHPPHFVDKIVIHKDGYQGGMYGAYGGYDIILVKLTRPVRGHTPACLPGPRYKPSLDVKIGGYGRYRYRSCFAWKTLELNIFVRRVPCETTSGGPEVI